MCIGGGQSLVNSILDESQLFKLIARVEPAPAFAALGHDQSVAILPAADRRRGQTKHPSDRSDAVDAASASQGAMSLSERTPSNMLSSARYEQFVKTCPQTYATA